MQYRIPLEGGEVLVVTLEVEPAPEVDADPASIGTALLNALGIGRPTKASSMIVGKTPARSPSGKPVVDVPRPVEEDPDKWLERTSRAALKQMKS